MAVSNEIASTLALAPLGTAAAKVQSRLLSSRVLAVGVVAVVEGLKNIVHRKGKDESLDMTEESDNPPPTKKLKKVRHGGMTNEDHYLVPSGDRGRKHGDLLDDQPKWVSDAGEVEGTAWESGTVGNGEEIDDTWESGSWTDEQDAYHQGGEDEDEDYEEHDVTTFTSTPSKTDLTFKSLPSEAPVRSVMQQSTFLPSLSVGFVRGESGNSDFSDSNDKVDLKKNRRGQRARRA
jgi:hypothetical protein